MRHCWIFFFLLGIFPLSAQDIYSLNEYPAVEIESVIRSSPFTGGINSAQIQTIDLTGDGIEEWITWDINTGQVLVFRKENEVFTHLPELSYFFPEDIAGFLILKDYDGDGKKDLFTATPLGIKVYKNTSTNGQVSWSVAQNFLKLDGSGNIQVNNLDRPLIQDLDGDGDLDLVAFNFAAGDYLEYYKNTSIERTGTADVDGFAFPEVYWGEFVFCGCADFSFGQTCAGKPFSRENFDSEDKRVQHAGGHSILYSDFNGDGISDLVLGRDECSTLYYLENKGTESEPSFISFSTDLPGFGVLPQFPIFHVGEKINGEMLISLNSNEAAYNFGIDFAGSIVKLDQNGNLEKGFLQNQLVDLGENSRVFIEGNKNSGEIWVTANTTQSGEVRSEITRFQISPTKITLLDKDFLGLSDLKLVDVQVLKTSSSGATHTIISGIRYENNFPSQLLFRYENENFVPFMFDGYEPKRGDFLQFFDYQNKNHLLVAAQNGSLSLYQIDLDGQKATLLENDFLGFVDNPGNRNLAVTVLQKDQPDLYAVDLQGKILRISNFMEEDAREEILVKVGSDTKSTRLGRKTWLSVLPPLFDEKPDLLLGTGAGGLIYLKSDNSGLPPSEEFLTKVFPNPSTGPIKVLANKDASATLITSLGQTLLSDIQIPANTEVEIQSGFLASGLYILRLEVDGRFLETRKIWIR